MVTALFVLNSKQPMMVDENILKTGDAQQDTFDNMIIDEAYKVGWPDPMLIKAQISQESDFNQLENTLGTQWAAPCGMKEDWTENESQSFGLLQITPACGGEESAMGIYPQSTAELAGHPILVTDANDTNWHQSLYNGNFNIHFGMYIASKNVEYFKSTFRDCTENQYLLMSLVAHNAGRNSVFGCNSFTDKGQLYVEHILARYHTFSKAASYVDRFV
jgi:hypothetical protein